MIQRNRVGLGTFPFTGFFNPISKKQSQNIILSFLDNGGYYIDTAPSYGDGEIEKLLGKTLKGISRDKFYVISKTIKHVDKNGKSFKSGKFKDVLEQIDNSLYRLNLDYIDQLMVHLPDDNSPIEETLRALEKLQAQGKVKELSVSNVNLEELKRYNQTGKIKYVENRFSLINRSLSPEFEKYLLDNKIGLIPYHLLEIGLLTGVAFENFKLRRGDLRRKLPYWNNDNQKLIFEWVRESLSPISKSLGITIGQLNISWALHQKFIGFVIVGTTKEEYLKINLKANTINLDDKSLSRIDNAYLELEQRIKSGYKMFVREFRGLNEKYY